MFATANLPAIRRTAAAWVRHVVASGARLDAASKAADALRFCAEHGTRSFVVPSALAAVTLHRPSVARVAQLLAASGHPVRLALSVCVVGEHTPRVLVSLPGGGPLGELRPQHHAWARALVPLGLECWAIRATGGVPGKPSPGLCIVLAGLPVALAAAARQRPALARVCAPRALAA